MNRVNLVEVSTDGMASWSPARLYRNTTPYAWVLWGFEWVPDRIGPVQVAVRAFDSNEETQPLEDNDYNDGINRIHVRTYEVANEIADLNGDGKIDHEDVMILMSRWYGEVPGGEDRSAGTATQPGNGCPAPLDLRTRPGE